MLRGVGGAGAVRGVGEKGGERERERKRALWKVSQEEGLTDRDKVIRYCGTTLAMLQLSSPKHTETQ